jgi:hypothetical protein
VYDNDIVIKRGAHNKALKEQINALSAMPQKTKEPKSVKY